MIKKISLQFAINTMLILLALALCYHVLILTELIPYQITWGGRLETKPQMYVVLVVIFSLNTVGNLFSNNYLEIIMFTPLTFISAVLNN